MGLDGIRRELSKVTDCGCEYIEGELERCDSHRAAYEAGKRVAHLPD